MKHSDGSVAEREVNTINEESDIINFCHCRNRRMSNIAENGSYMLIGGMYT